MDTAMSKALGVDTAMAKSPGVDTAMARRGYSDASFLLHQILQQKVRNVENLHGKIRAFVLVSPPLHLILINSHLKFSLKRTKRQLQNFHSKHMQVH